MFDKSLLSVYMNIKIAHHSIQDKNTNSIMLEAGTMFNICSWEVILKFKVQLLYFSQ